MDAPEHSLERGRRSVAALDDDSHSADAFDSSACPSDDEVAAFVDGAGPPALRERIQAHVADCSRCAATLAAFVRDFGGGSVDAASDTIAALGPDDGTLAPADAGARPRFAGGGSPDGRYVFGEPFGAGGLGLVRRAEDLRLGRQVAIKELLLPTPEAERRFLREATITARLQHPSIVPIYDIGRHPTGEPFYCMRLIDGRTLEHAIRRCDGLVARLGLLEHVIAAADAVAYAHRRGVIHRDLKPANILIGEVGETVVIDWGLAKDLSGALAEELGPADATSQGAAPALTQAGAVMGTLRYMPPEQAMGGEVDARSDVFALGAVLFHLLAGEAPYAGRTGAELLAHVAGGKVEDLRALVPDAPAELVAIAHKAMAAERAARYASASEFAEDLRRFRTGRLVGAHHYSASEVLRRWLRRHRSLVAVGAASLALLTIFAVYAVQNIRRERDAAELASTRAAEERERALAAEVEAQGQREEAERQRSAAREQLVATLNARATDAVQLGAAGEALLAAGAVLAVREDAMARGALVAGASGLFEPLLWSAPLSGRAAEIVWHPVAGVLVLEQERVERWTADGEVMAPLTGGRFAFAIEPSPDGRRIALDSKGALAIYEPAVRVDGPVLRIADGRWAGAYGFVWRDDDHVIASDGVDSAGLWRLSTGERVGAWSGQPGPLRAMAARPDRRLVITGAHGHTVRAWDPWTFKEIGPLEQAGVGAFSVAVAPDGAFAAAGGEVRGGDGKVRIWDLRSFAIVEAFRAHRGEVHFVRFSPDGRWLGTGGSDETLRLWHVPSFTEVAALRSPGGRSPRFAFAPDGARIAVAFGSEPRLRVYSLQGSAGGLEPKHFPRPIETVAWSPDGRRLAAAQEDGLVHVFDTSTRAAVIAGEAKPGAYLAGKVLEWVDDERLLITGGGGELVIVDPGTGGVRERAASTRRPKQMSSSAKSRVLIHDAPESFFLRLGEGSIAREPVACAPPSQTPFNDMVGAWTPDGAGVLVTLTNGRIVRVPVDGSPCAEFGPTDRSVDALQFSPAGELAAVSTGDELLLLEFPSWALRASLERRRVTISTLRFTADGSWLFAADWSGIVSAWRVADGSLGARWQAHQNRIWTMELSPDGRFLATGGADRRLRTWDLEPLLLPRERTAAWIEGRLGEAPGVDGW